VKCGTAKVKSMVYRVEDDNVLLKWWSNAGIM